MTAVQKPATGQQETAPADAADTERAPNHRGYEGAIGVAVIAIGAVCLALTSQIDVARDVSAFGPRWWPTVLSIAMIAIGGVLVAQAVVIRTVADELDITRSGGLTLATTLALIVGYGCAWQYLDFRAVTVVLLAGLVFAFGGRGLKALVVFPVVTTLLLWAIFGLLLRVPL